MSGGWRSWLGPAATAFVAVLLAAAALGTHDPSRLVRDALGYHRLAEELLLGHGFINTHGYPEVVRTPGYPLLVATIYRLFGVNLWAVYAAHAALHAASTALLVKLAERILGPSRGWLLLVGFGYALFPFALHGATRILTESLTTALFLAALAVLALSERRSRFAIAGALFGLVALVRPSFALLPFGLAFIISSFRPPARDVKGAATLLGAALLVLAPWSVRTSLLVERPSFISAGGFGNNLHIATWEYRDLSSGLPRTTDYETPTFLENDRRAMESLPQPKGSVAWTVALDRARLQLGLEELRTHPWLYFRASMIRVFKVWTSQHLPGLPAWAGNLAALSCLGLLGLGILGAWRRWPWSDAEKLLLGSVLYVWLVHIPLHAEARYTLPARPVLLLFAIVALMPRSTTRRAVPAERGVDPPPDP